MDRILVPHNHGWVFGPEWECKVYYIISMRSDRHPCHYHVYFLQNIFKGMQIKFGVPRYSIIKPDSFTENVYIIHFCAQIDTSNSV